MAIPGNDIIISQTKKWITEVVAGCGFCPFAAKEIKRGSIHYEVLAEAGTRSALEAMMALIYQLDKDKKIETSLLIMSQGFKSFTNYLQLIEMAETLLKDENYEGVYQLASFHPEYLFAGSNAKDPANYTNRSPYPMIHFLREASVSKAIDGYPDIEKVPGRNIAFAKEKGLLHMQQLLAACMGNDI